MTPEDIRRTGVASQCEISAKQSNRKMTLNTEMLATHSKGNRVHYLIASSGPEILHIKSLDEKGKFHHEAVIVDFSS